MSFFVGGVSILATLIWVYLIAGRQGYWRADQRLSGTPPQDYWPAIAIVIPARDEIDTIELVVSAHTRTSYPGERRLYVVDDASSDGTGAAAAKAGTAADFPVRVVSAPPLPDGWTGKMNAVAAGIAAAEADGPVDYLLLTDADILHAPGALISLVARARAKRLALVSLMARLDARGFWGSTLIPAFVYFFQKLYPFPAVNDPANAIAAAAGGCMLVDANALAEEGSIAAIHDALIDDCALAALIKGGTPKRRIWLGLSQGEVVSLRDNRSLQSVWNMVARTAYAELDHAPLKLIGTILGMGLVYCVPPISLIAGLYGGGSVLLTSGALSMLLMVISYLPTLRIYNKPGASALLLPAVAVLYTLMVITSALRHILGRGGAWKGRTYGR